MPQSCTATSRRRCSMARNRASMREGPLAELFRATEAAQRQETERADDAGNEQQALPTEPAPVEETEPPPPEPTPIRAVAPSPDPVPDPTSDPVPGSEPAPAKEPGHD